MRTLLLTLLPLAGLKAQTIEFDGRIDDWYMIDCNGDEWRDLLVLLEPVATSKGKPARLFLGGPKGFEETQKLTLPEETIVFSLGDFDGRQGEELALIAPDALTMLSVDADGKAQLRAVDAAIETVFRAGTPGAPRIWHRARDIDGDGRDDLFLPSEEGVRVHFGSEQGKLSPAHPLLLRGRREARRAPDALFAFERSYPSPVFAHVAAAERKDLAWFDEQGLAWRAQGKDRTFGAGSPQRLELPWLSARSSTGLLEQTDVELEDIDGDGLDELVLAKMTAAENSVTQMTTNLAILKNRGGKEPFARKPGFALRLDGVVGIGPSFEDVNGDGRTDLILGTYGTSIGAAISRFIVNSVPVRLYVHLGREGETLFDRKPDLNLKIKLDRDDFEEWKMRGTVSLGDDFDGDGVMDLFRFSGKGKRRRAVVQRGLADDGGFSLEDEERLLAPAAEIDGSSRSRLRKEGPALLVLERERSLEFRKLRR